MIDYTVVGGLRCFVLFNMKLVSLGFGTGSILMIKEIEACCSAGAHACDYKRDRFRVRFALEEINNLIFLIFRSGKIGRGRPRLIFENL